MRVAAASEAIPLSVVRRLLRAEGSELAAFEFAEDAEYESWFDDDDLEVEPESIDEGVADRLDLHVDLLRSEIDERRRLAAQLYPFTIDDDSVQRQDACGATVYLLLLVLACADLPYRGERRAHEVEEAYDMVAMAALRQMSPPSRGVRFARTARHKSDSDGTARSQPALSHETAAEGADTGPSFLPAGQRPTSFPAAIRWLQGLLDLGPGPGNPATEPDAAAHWEDVATPRGRPPLTSYNDAGVDVVVWRPFADGRQGFPVLLAQCTVQRNWAAKVDDINIDLWRSWIDFPTAPPQKVLVIPFADTGPDARWTSHTTRAGMILERRRLLELLGRLDCHELEQLADERVTSWVEQELRAA